MKNLLVGCEESQRVCAEFRKAGWNAFSCDIVDPSGGHPEWHIKGDVLPLLNGNCQFKTMDGKTHIIEGKWDMLILHPPCTDLSVSGARYFEKKRADGRQRNSIEFFGKCLTADCDKICVENPINIIAGGYLPLWFPDLAEKYNLPLKPTQIIQPWMFGDNASKKTCLWLKGLPQLEATDIVEPDENGRYANQTKDGQNKVIVDGKWIGFNDPRTAIERSKTYPGIARAMRTFWSNL